MKMLSFCCLLMLFVSSAPVRAQNITDFFAVAESVITHPPYKPRLAILTQKKLSNRYVTIIGFKEDKSILIAAVTLEPIKNVMKEILLSVRFEGTKPTVGKTNTWGYIFDRNGDGSIDYMALLGGAALVKDKEFPEDYPYRGQTFQQHHIKYYAKQCKMVFNHWADDNFDGTLDALIQVDMERERDVIDRRLVIRSTAFNGKFDDVWGLHLLNESIQDSIQHTETSVPYLPIGGTESEITPGTFTEKTEIFKLLNKAIKQSKLSAKNFPKFTP